MQKMMRTMAAVIGVSLLTAGSCYGPEEMPVEHPIKLGQDLVDAAKAHDLNPRLLQMQRQSEDGSWDDWTTFQGETDLDDRWVEDDCNIAGDIRLVDPADGAVLMNFPSPMCFEDPLDPFVITLDVVDWPAVAE